MTNVHSPSFWLGAHASLVLACICLAPFTGGTTLLSTVPSLLCLWANWSSNFQPEAQSSDEQSQLSVNARRAGAEMAQPDEQNPVSRSSLPNRSVLPREPL